MLRAGSTLGFFAFTLVLACSEAELSPDSGATGPRCCFDGERSAIKDQCAAGEIGLPVDRCEGVDAGAADALALPDATMSPDAGGASICGNDVIETGEVCEQGADCNDATLICRRCQCRSPSSALELHDPEGDADQTTVRQVDFVDVDMTAAAPPAVELEMRMADGAMPQTLPQSICLILLEAGNAVQRLCWNLSASGTFSATLRDAAGERTLDSSVMIGTLDPSLEVPAGIGLRIEEGIDFYWVSYYGAIEADRLPDVGSIPMTDLIGR